MFSRTQLLILFVLLLLYTFAVYRFAVAIIRKERFILRGFRLWILAGGALTLLRVACLWYVAHNSEKYSGSWSLWPPWVFLSPELVIAELFNPQFFYIEFWGERFFWIFMAEFILIVSFALAFPALLVGLGRRKVEGRFTGRNVRTK